MTAAFFTMTLFSSLRYPSFAFLWTGQTISRLGDNLYRVALAWWVLEKTGSAAAMGTVLIFTSVPMLLFLLIGGVAVDRFPRARVMFLSDVTRGAVVGIVTLLAFADVLQIWHIYIASILFGFVSAFFQPAYGAIIPDLVPLDSRPSANSLTALSGQITGILGPALGAGMVALSGTSSAFAFDAVSFFISALCLLPVLRVNIVPANPTRARSGMLQDFNEGWRMVIALPWLWIMLALEALLNLTQAGPYAVALPFLVKNTLHSDVQVLGWFYSAASIGSVVVAVWLGRYAKLHRRGMTGFILLTLWGLSTAVLGLPLGVPPLVVSNLVVGGSVSAFNLIESNIIQEMVPQDHLGRVYSIGLLGSFVLLPIGYGVAGWATDLVGAPTVLLVGGILTAVLALIGLAQPPIRHLD